MSTAIIPRCARSPQPRRRRRGITSRNTSSAGGTLTGPLRHKTHLLFTWLNDLIRHPGILDPVEDIIGPNILCWGTSFFIKEARDSQLRLLAPGQHLLGAGAAGYRHRLGRHLGKHAGERRHAGHPGQHTSAIKCRIATPSRATTC